MSTFGERRPYFVPDTLDELTGPAVGRIELPVELSWTGRRSYNLDDPDDTIVLYERVLVDAVDGGHITHLVNANLLSTLWNRLFLPRRVRQLWELRFPNLGGDGFE